MRQALATIMAGLCLQGAAWAQGSADTALLEMREAFRRNNPAALSALLPSVRGHTLEPLASYWEMKARLDTASPAEIRATLQRHAGSYWEDRLRNDWLLVLAQNRDWANFSAELPAFRMNDDRQVQCYALMLDAAANRLPGEAAAQRVQTLWHAQREADDGCATAAKALLDSGHLKPLAVWQRARLAMDTNRPAAVSQAVALLNPQWVPLLDEVTTAPARYLDEKFTAIRTRTKEMVVLAAIRLASTDPAAAAQAMQEKRWVLQLTQEERGWVWGAIGKRAAQKLQPEALSYFANGQDRFMTDDHLAWKARAALRTGAWSEVHEAIAHMSDSQAKESTWVYWRARAIQALGEPDAVQAALKARELYDSIASPDGFYEQLALEELGQRIATPAAPAPLTAQEREAAARNPGLQRALEAFRLGLRGEAVREWHYTVALHKPGGLPDRELLAAAEIACRAQLWDRCINTSLRTTESVDHAQRFPMPHQTEVVKRAQEIGLDPAYVYGLIKQESRFVTDARSHVGASGLMQVMPATARWTARKIGLTNFRPHQITDRDTNILIGTAYLKLALDDFEGSLPLAAAAYNAGPSRARNWRNGPVMAGDIWAENIPFEETRDYVKRVLANTTSYAALITGQPQSLRERLGRVGPPADGSRPINTELP